MVGHLRLILNNTKGEFSEDGVGAAIDIIRNSPGPVTLLAIAPLPNFQALLNRAPELASKIIVKAMSGSYQVCFNEEGKLNTAPCPEYNVAGNISAAQATYAAVWNTPMTTSPRDIGYNAIIGGDNYQKLLHGTNIILSTLMECYLYWNQHGGWGNPAVSSTQLWDPTAAYMVWSDSSLLKFVTVNMIVNSNGVTVVDSSGRKVNVSDSWVNNGEQMWFDLVTNKLLGA